VLQQKRKPLVLSKLGLAVLAPSEKNEWGKMIAMVRRDQPPNTDIMRALERRP
jgi:hypothetical protein